MGHDDYSSFLRELNSIQPRGLRFSSGSKSIGNIEYISAGITAVLLWIVLSVWTPGWLKTKNGGKNALLIGLVGIVLGVMVGAGVYFLA